RSRSVNTRITWDSSITSCPRCFASYRANPYIIAGVVTVGTVLISKNSILSIILGIISLVALRTFL
ncbi:MAG: AzlD domain-containing protein, partial [Dethiobacter sp.]|nr:AzlD domain-containing protein [Dethiobacter sp.]